MKVGFTCSAFDLLHAGHILMLEEAKAVCDYLIVGLHVDPSIDRKEKNRPIQGVFERYMQIKGCKYVDEIIPYETEEELVTMLRALPINTRIIGSDYYDKDYTGKDVCKLLGIDVYYNNRNHQLSTTDLRNRIQNGAS